MKTMQETNVFDKFMDEIIQKEVRQKPEEAQENTPTREYRKRYAEHPHNRMRVK